jgi:hypothetical protein
MPRADPRASRFALGCIVATPGALDALAAAKLSPHELLRRHRKGDWGDLVAADAESNEQALRYGSRILSSYGPPDGGKVWVITEADRSVTTILLPSEY